MSNYKKLFSNTLFMVIGQFSNKILSFFLVPLYTYILSTEEFGMYDLISTTIMLLSPVLTVVISEAVMRFCLDKESNKQHILSAGLSFVLLGTATLILLSPIFIAVNLFGNYFGWLVVFFVTNNLESVLMQYLKGIEKVKFYTFCGVFQTFTMFILNILFLAVFQWGIVGYMSAISVSRLLIILLIAVKEKLWKLIVNPFQIPKTTYSSLLKYTVPMIPNSVSWWISNSSDKYMIRYIISASAVGIYSVAYKIPTLLSMFVSIFISAFQISSVEDFGSKESVDFFSNVYKGFSSVCIIVASLLIVSSGVFGKILFQNEFFLAWRVSCILVLAFLFNALAAYLGTIYTTAKKTGFLFYSTMIASVLNIILNVALINYIGMYGAAIATLVSYFCVWIIRLIYSRKIIPLNVNVARDCISYVLLLVEATVMIWADRLINPIAIGIVLIVVLINGKLLLSSVNDFIKKNRLRKESKHEFI